MSDKDTEIIDIKSSFIVFFFHFVDFFHFVLIYKKKIGLKC